MKSRVDVLEVRFDKHLTEYESRGALHERNNRIQEEFALEINKLNSQLAQQGLILGQHGVSLGQQDNLFKEMKDIWGQIAEEMGDIKTYVAIEKSKNCMQRWLVEIAIKLSGWVGVMFTFYMIINKE